MKIRTAIFSLALSCLIIHSTVQTSSPGFQAVPAAASQLTLASAVVCENVNDYTPQNPAIVFSISAGEISCFCLFDPVPQDTHIYHNWYYRDRLTTKLKLALKPPRWSTFSTIQLRESDIGPWRVEITDQGGQVIDILRFSITE